MVGAKREWARVTRASLYLASVYLVVRAIEEAVEEPDYMSVRVSFSGRPEDLGEGGSLEAVVEGVEGVEGEYELEGGRLLQVYTGEAPSGAPLYKLMLSLPRAVWRLDGAEIRRLARETSERGVEYMVVYFPSGLSVWVEGDVHRVEAPPLRGVVGAVHTHPKGSCGLSRQDALSALDLMVDGGIFEAAATEDCMFYIVRFSLLSEPDYVRLLNVGSEGLWKPERMDSVEAGILY